MSQLMNIDFAIVILYLLVTLIIGLYSGRGIKTMKDYVIGDRDKYTTPVLVMTLLATLLGGGSTSGTVEKIFIFEAYNDPNKQKKLAINRYLTEEESKDLSEYAELREPCRNLVIKEMETAHPDYAMVFVETFAESNTQTVKLLKIKV